MNDSTTIFIDFHKKHPKTLCFSVVSRPAGAQVPIFTAQMKKASKKHQKTTVFFDFSNHAGAQVPIFTPKMKNFRFARLARLARLSTRKWDFRRRSRPRELAQRRQDDVSLNKLFQIRIYSEFTEEYRQSPRIYLDYFRVYSNYILRIPRKYALSLLEYILRSIRRSKLWGSFPRAPTIAVRL